MMLEIISKQSKVNKSRVLFFTDTAAQDTEVAIGALIQLVP